MPPNQSNDPPKKSTGHENFYKYSQIKNDNSDYTEKQNRSDSNVLKHKFASEAPKIFKLDRDELEKIFYELSSVLKFNTERYIRKVKSLKIETFLKEEYEKTVLLFLPDKKKEKSPKTEAPDLNKPIDPKGKSSFTSPSLVDKLNSLWKNISGISKRIPAGQNMSSAAGSAVRKMKYPYTYAAKIAHFPYKFYVNNNWMWKYYIIAAGVSFPIFYKLSRMSNSPENVKKWEEIRREAFTPGHGH